MCKEWAAKSHIMTSGVTLPIGAPGPAHHAEILKKTKVKFKYCFGPTRSDVFVPQIFVIKFKAN